LDDEPENRFHIIAMLKPSWVG